MAASVTAVMVAFVAGVLLATLARRPHRARRARRAYGWEAFKASIADALLLLDFKGVYSVGVGSSNPAPTGDSPHQIRTL